MQKQCNNWNTPSIQVAFLQQTHFLANGHPILAIQFRASHFLFTTRYQGVVHMKLSHALATLSLTKFLSLCPGLFTLKSCGISQLLTFLSTLLFALQHYYQDATIAMHIITQLIENLFLNQYYLLIMHAWCMADLDFSGICYKGLSLWIGCCLL